MRVRGFCDWSIFIRLIGALVLLLRPDAATAVLVQGVEGLGR
jgi:hypothetical protein